MTPDFRSYKKLWEYAALSLGKDKASAVEHLTLTEFTFLLADAPVGYTLYHRSPDACIGMLSRFSYPVLKDLYGIYFFLTGNVRMKNRYEQTLIGLLCEKDPHSDLYKKLQVEFSWRQFRKQGCPAARTMASRLSLHDVTPFPEPSTSSPSFKFGTAFNPSLSGRPSDIHSKLPLLS